VEFLKDPYSETTRKQRRALVAASAVGIVLSATGPVPKEMAVLGLKFDEADLPRLLWLLAALIVYFAIGFLTALWPDVIASSIPESMMPGPVPVPTMPIRPPSWPTLRLSLLPWTVRHLYETFFPLVFAGVALVGLAWRAAFDVAPSGFLYVVGIAARVLSVAFLGVAALMLIMVGIFSLMFIPTWLRIGRLGGGELEPNDSNPRQRAPTSQSDEQ
jgi:hypothetical protein